MLTRNRSKISTKNAKQNTPDLLQLTPEVLKECFSVFGTAMLGRCVCKELKASIECFPATKINLSTIGTNKLNQAFLQCFSTSRLDISSESPWSERMKWTKAVFYSLRDNIVLINTIRLKLTDETAQALVSSIRSEVPNMLHRRIGCLNVSLYCDLNAKKMNKTAQAFCEISSWFEN